MEFFNRLLAPENGKWGPEKLRQLLFQDYPSKYRILFPMDGDRVHVIQVRHDARRWFHEGEDQNRLRAVKTVGSIT